MSRKAGALLWNRVRVEFPFNVSFVNVDTGLTQVAKSFAGMSPGEPSFSDPSRVQVIPLVPTANWINIAHHEPYFDPATGTIHVLFFFTGGIPEPPGTISVPPITVLFWNPHSLVGPGRADTYEPPE